jgi:hypothetical protein
MTEERELGSGLDRVCHRTELDLPGANPGRAHREGEKAVSPGLAGLARGRRPHQGHRRVGAAEQGKWADGRGGGPPPVGSGDRQRDREDGGEDDEIPLPSAHLFLISLVLKARLVG